MSDAVSAIGNPSGTKATAIVTMSMIRPPTGIQTGFAWNLVSRLSFDMAGLQLTFLPQPCAPADNNNNIEENHE